MSSETATIFLTTKEAANELRIGLSMVYKLIKAGTLRPVKIGSRTLVPRNQITAMAGGH